MTTAFPARWLAALALLVSAVFLRAGEVEFSAENFVITPPEGWHKVPSAEVPQANVAMTFANRDGTEVLLVILKNPDGPFVPVDDAFVRGFEIGAERQGSHKVWGKFVNVQGIQSYERLGSSTRPRAISTLSRTIPADGKYYIVQGVRMDGRADGSAAITNALASFRFINPPAPVKSSVAFRAGYIAGKVTLGLLGIGVVVAVVVGAVMLARRGRRNPPPLP